MGTSTRNRVHKNQGIARDRTGITMSEYRDTLLSDASDVGLGSVLTQKVEGTERVVTYTNRALRAAEKHYSAMGKEQSYEG